MIGDEHLEDDNGNKYYETICECFTMEDAVEIAEALNKGMK